MVSNPLTDPEWAGRSVDLIDRVVATVRRYTTQPVVATARGAVFGLLAAFGAAGIVILAGIGVTRALIVGLDTVLPHPAAVWVAYLGLAGSCFAAGTILMRRRFTAGEEDAP